MSTAFGPYSPSVLVGDFLYISGQLGVYPDGELADGIDAQCRQAIANVRTLLEERNLGPEHIVKTTIYLVDMSDYPVMNDIYGEVMYAPYPARAAVEVSGLPRGALIEIEAVAHAGK